jgi:hypothetical protein
MDFSISTTSSQRSNFQPQFENVPVGSKPQARWTPMDPWLAESPITAISLRTPDAFGLCHHFIEQ